MENLCKARKISISQIQKYLFPIQVNPVFQELGTPPSRDASIDNSKGLCLLALHLAVLNPWKRLQGQYWSLTCTFQLHVTSTKKICFRQSGCYSHNLSQCLWHWATRNSLHLDGMPVYRRVTPSIKFTSTHLYTWVGRGTVRVKCLPQEHNMMSLSRVHLQTFLTFRSRVQCSDYHAAFWRAV